MTLKEIEENFQTWLSTIINIEHPRVWNEGQQKWEYPPQYITPYFAFENELSEDLKNQETGDVTKEKTPPVRFGFRKISFTRTPQIFYQNSVNVGYRVENGVRIPVNTRNIRATFFVYEIGTTPDNLFRILNVLRSGTVNDLERSLCLFSLDNDDLSILPLYELNSAQEYTAQSVLTINFNTVLSYKGLDSDFIDSISGLGKEYAPDGTVKEEPFSVER